MKGFGVLQGRRALAGLLMGMLACHGFAQEPPTDAETEFGKAWIAGISATSPDEDVLLATLLAQQHEPSAVPGLLSRTLASPAYEKLRLSVAWYHCRNNPGSEFCVRKAPAGELIALDPANVEPYLYATLTALEAGEEEAALAALTAGNLAAGATTYYLEKQNIVRNRLSVAGYPADRLTMAAESLPAPLDTYVLYARLLAACAARSKESAQWKLQCSALGNKLVTVGNTVVQNIHGFGMMRDALDEGSPARTEVVERMAAYNAIRDEANAKLDWVTDMSRKPDIVYDEINEFGEFHALERALQRLETQQTGPRSNDTE